MKNLFFLMLLMLPFFGSADDKPSPNILFKTITWLEGLETVEYDQSFYSLIDNYRWDSKNFFDFNSNDTLLGAKFHFVYDQRERHNYKGESIYNGKKRVDIDMVKKLVITEDSLSVNVVNSPISMTYSLLSLKKALPIFLNDTAVKKEYLKDTVINDQLCYVFRFTDRGRTLVIGTLFRDIPKDRIHEQQYLIAVNKDTFRPVFFSQWDEEYGKRYSTYANINENASRPDSVWTEKYYPPTYKILTWKEYATASLEPVEDTKDWQFSTMDGKQVKMSDYKEKLVLLEFWFVGCAPCVKAVPFLNELKEQYQNKLAVVAVEYMNEKQKIEDYLDKKNFSAKYEILYNGQETAKELGVNGAPTFFLINEEGEVVFQTLGYSEKIKNEIIKHIAERL